MWEIETLLTVECKIIRDVDGIRKPTFGNHHCNNWFRQKPSVSKGWKFKD